jgi:hypothetical protein
MTWPWGIIGWSMLTILSAGTLDRPGVPPSEVVTCPAMHPIKGNFTTSSGERCISHPPGGQFYTSTRPERCYATDAEAQQDGCRPSRR